MPLHRESGMPAARALANACLVLTMLAAAPSLAADSGGRTRSRSISPRTKTTGSSYESVRLQGRDQGREQNRIRACHRRRCRGWHWGSEGRKFPYYRARENGAEAAIRFMADADSIPADRLSPTAISTATTSTVSPIATP